MPPANANTKDKVTWQYMMMANTTSRPIVDKFHNQDKSKLLNTKNVPPCTNAQANTYTQIGILRALGPNPLSLERPCHHGAHPRMNRIGS